MSVTRHATLGTVILVGSPLDASKHRGNIIRRAPAVLKDVEAQFACGIDIWVEHLADEFD